MSKKTSKCLVIDASVARASGQVSASNSVAVSCRDVLMGVLQICHRLVMTTEISNEWKKHASRFAFKWRVSMNARRKVERPGNVRDDALRAKIEKSIPEGQNHEVVLKDIPLIEAAMATDHIIITRDDEAREVFNKMSEEVNELKSLSWINPAKGEGTAVDWLSIK
jgi:hypothetical protein